MPPCRPVVGTRESGLPFGAYLCLHLFLGWADLFARIGRSSTAVNLSGGIDWVFRFVPMEACRAYKRPLMKRVWDMWLALSSFLHPCSLEVRSERSMASSLPPRLQTRPLHHPYRVDSLTHAFKPKPFHPQLNISSYSYFLSPFANRNRQIVGDTALSNHYCPSQPAVCAHNSLWREKNGKKKYKLILPPLSRAKQTANLVTAQWKSI